MNAPHILTSVNAFRPISLHEMDSVGLMDRFDYKLVFPETSLSKLLDGLHDHYRVLEVNNIRMCRYDNRYFDTAERDFFLMHHNNKANRLKVRFRKYVDSNVTFFEIKCKTNKGKTVKQRITCDDIPTNLNDTFKEMLSGFIDNEMINRLKPMLDNSFTRITLVNNQMTDRLTIDTNVSFNDFSKSASMNGLVIVELKQEGPTIRPYLRDLFRNTQMMPVAVSKYIVGSLMLNPELKHNNFKNKLHLIDKLNHAA